MPKNPKHLIGLNDMKALAVECSHCSIVFTVPVLESANRKAAKLPQVCPSCDTLWIENKHLDTLVGDFLWAYGTCIRKSSPRRRLQLASK